jgi:hypothetical protein
MELVNSHLLKYLPLTGFFLIASNFNNVGLIKYGNQKMRVAS